MRPTIRGGDSLSFLYSICRRSVPSILPGKWNNQSTNIYKLYTIIPATLKQLQIDFSLAAFDVLHDSSMYYCYILNILIFDKIGAGHVKSNRRSLHVSLMLNLYIIYLVIFCLVFVINLYT